VRYRDDKTAAEELARITALYQVLGHLWPSPIVELNRALTAT